MIGIVIVLYRVFVCAPCPCRAVPWRVVYRAEGIDPVRERWDWVLKSWRREANMSKQTAAVVVMVVGDTSATEVSFEPNGARRAEENKGEEMRGKEGRERKTHKVQSNFDFSSVLSFAGFPPTPIAAAMPASPPPPLPVLRRFAAGSGAASGFGFGGLDPAGPADPDVDVAVDVDGSDSGPKRASRDAVVGSVGFAAVEGAGAAAVGGGGAEVAETAASGGGWRAK